MSGRAWERSRGGVTMDHRKRELDGEGTVTVRTRLVASPVLFVKRQYLTADAGGGGSTTACVKTRNPTDYGPDDYTARSSSSWYGIRRVHSRPVERE